MKIKKFNESTTSKLEKVWYIDLYDLREASDEEVEEWTNDHPHSNGYAARWEVMDPKDDAAYPKIEQYFLDNGLKVGDIVIVHSEW
jgi:aminoglycoside N3'-acetyltransferase